jgi:LysR family transcriptional regulator, nitrogen assimilation regulatory protein
MNVHSHQLVREPIKIMDIRQLKYFMAIADCGSLSQASIRLHVVQSALSHNLSQLEEELRAKLFHRRPRGVEVTEAGKLLYKYAKEVLSILDEAKLKISTLDAEVHKQIWIGANHTATRMILPDLPKKLVEAFPQIKFGFVEDLSSTLVEYLVDGKSDIALTYNPPDELSLHRLPVLEERVCCVGSPQLLGEGDKPITFDEVVNLPLILPGQGANLRGTVKHVEEANKLIGACVMEINSLSFLISVLKEGMGCTVFSRTTVAEEIDKGDLVLRPIIDPEIRRDLYIVFLPTARNTPLLDELARFIQKHIHDHLAANPIDGIRVLE